MNTVHFVSNAHYYLFGPVPGFFFLMQCWVAVNVFLIKKSAIQNPLIDPLILTADLK
jgi:hypothetical protein